MNNTSILIVFFAFANLKKICHYRYKYYRKGGRFINIYSWHVFSTVAEQKSFIKAAGVLNISQSAVSHTITKLEKECGYALFVRNRNNIELTTNGQSLIPLVRQLLNCDNSLSQEVLKLKNVHSGEVKIAAFHSATLLWLPEIIDKFKEGCPNVRVKVRQSGDKDIVRMETVSSFV